MNAREIIEGFLSDYDDNDSAVKIVTEKIVNRLGLVWRKEPPDSPGWWWWTDETFIPEVCGIDEQGHVTWVGWVGEEDFAYIDEYIKRFPTSLWAKSLEPVGGGE